MAADPRDDIDDDIEEEQLILGDLLNHVLDKGVVISGSVTISIADIDLLVLDLKLLLTSVESAMKRQSIGAGTSAQSDPGKKP